MSMNELLANYYGTNGSGQAEELEKQAQVELFAKLASDNGIDLNELNDDQVQGLWESTFKTAGDDEEDEDKKKAKEEFAEKKESADKLAEADFLGRTMAHAYVDELDKIAGGATFREIASVKAKRLQRSVGGAASRAGSRAKELLTGSAVKRMEGQRKKLVNMAENNPSESVRDRAATALRSRDGAALKSEKNKVLAARLGVGGAGAATIGGAGYAIHKKGSAIDNLASELAVEKAAAAGFDPEEAAERIDAVLTLGMDDSIKVASAESLEAAVDIRSLEVLEAAGYPIEWA